MEMKCEMTLEKETKGAIRYMEKGDPDKHMLRTLYVRKSAFAGRPAPKEIVVTMVGV